MQAARASNAALMTLIAAAVILAIAFGTRQSFGLLMLPITTELGWGRESLSLVFAVQALLNGFAAPFMGAVSDRWGTARTVAIGCLLYVAGLVAMAEATNPLSMYLGGGVLVGLGISACGLPVMLGAIGRAAPENKRSLWLGFATAGGTAGQILIIPGMQAVIEAADWRFALLILASIFALLIPVTLCFRAADRGRTPSGVGQKLSDALREAGGHRGYCLLVAGFFVCGFQVQFIVTHLPAYLTDGGLGLYFAGSALAVIAFFNMFRSWTAGYLGGLHRQKHLLIGIYLARAAIIAVFISVPLTETSAMIFAGMMGFIWLGTVPLTSGIVARVFGPRYMATLFGVVFLSHQLGNFAGAWIGGLVFDATGRYDAVWWMAIGLSLAAAALHAPIDDRPVARLAAAVAA